MQYLQLRCPEDTFLPQQTRKKGTAEAQSLQHIISDLATTCAFSSRSAFWRVLRLPGSRHLLAQEVRSLPIVTLFPCKRFAKHDAILGAGLLRLRFMTATP